MLAHSEWVLRDPLPEAMPYEVFPGLARSPLEVSLERTHAWELPLGERALIGGIVAWLQPRTLIEIGTFTGVTTRWMAERMPEGAVLHTVDLPEGGNLDDPASHGRVGEAFRGDPRWEGRIVQHRGDSRTMAMGPFPHGVDLVFIDGSHEFGDVLLDSRRAFEWVGESGVILWDDYQPSVPGVVEALGALARERREAGEPGVIWHLAGTRLAACVVSVP